MMRWLLTLALLASTLRADSPAQVLADMAAELAAHQDAKGTATAVLEKPDIRPHRAHGKLPTDYVQNLVLANSRTTYRLRYWMNVATAAAEAGTAIEGSTGLGMDMPNTANWYSNNFFEFAYGGKEILKSSMARLTVVESGGERALVALSWDTPEAEVTLEVALAAGADALELRCRVAAKGEPRPVRLGFRAYPGHMPPPRARRAVTCQRELLPETEEELAAPETTLVLFDEAEPHQPCAIRFAEAGQTAARLSLQSYGVTVFLDYPPAAEWTSGPIQLWDFRNASLNETLDRLLVPAGGR